MENRNPYDIRVLIQDLHDLLHMLYDWFKHDKIVEHLLECATRYVRAFYVVSPARQSAIVHWFAQWRERLGTLRAQLPQLVAVDTTWLRAEQFLREIGYVEPTTDTSEQVIQRIFELQIDYCLRYFEQCESVCERRLPVSCIRKMERRAFDAWNNWLEQARSPARVDRLGNESSHSTVVPHLRR